MWRSNATRAGTDTALGRVRHTSVNTRRRRRGVDRHAGLTKDDAARDALLRPDVKTFSMKHAEEDMRQSAETAGIIVIAPRPLWNEIGERLGAHDAVKFFETAADLESWRLGELHRASIYPHVVRALEEIGSAQTTLSTRLKHVLRRLCESNQVPRLDDLLAGLPKRTFYVAWRAELPESPRKFLERVRLRHALWLIEEAGLSAQEAAYSAGFSDAATFYRLRRRSSQSE
ncbi:MAG TPA: helix-turn-helix domain-containing protein [Thermoanaerobaculia bacterium]|nr:helix-turn-helix domain-containing protein [Thermoanaerobaculia bacterium]